MAAPRFAPNPPIDDARSYASPDHVPGRWMPDRPAEIDGDQPTGPRLGYQGPDQGYALVLAERLRPSLQMQPGERDDDAIGGCLAIALRRASLFGRAPVVHDLRIAFTIWGFLAADPPADLVELRRQLFTGAGNPRHGYLEARHLADMVPESTLRQTPDQIAAAWPAAWRQLTGA
jgi:hypothetical protein